MELSLSEDGLGDVVEEIMKKKPQSIRLILPK